MNDGEKIDQLLRARNLTQAQLSRELKVSESYLSNIRHGLIKISKNLANKICDSLDIDMSYFESDDGVITNKVEESEKKEDAIEANEALSQEDIKDYEDIIKISIKLTELRNDLLNKIKKDRESDRLYNGVDQDFLHRIENLDKLSNEEAINLVLNEKKSRKSRRVTKNRIFLIQGLLNGVTLVNPYSFTISGIERAKNYEYQPRVVSEITNEKEG